MIRLDAVSFSAPSPGPSPSHTFSLNLHELLLDDLHLPNADHPFLCSSVANLPRGVGVGHANTISLLYDHQIKVGVVSDILYLYIVITDIFLS